VWHVLGHDRTLEPGHTGSCFRRAEMLSCMHIPPHCSWAVRTAGHVDAVARGRAALLQLVHQRDRPQALAAAGAAAHAPAVRPIRAGDGTELLLDPGVRCAVHASAMLRCS